MKVVAFLPAKGNSERVENKNIKLLDGKPLFLHNLEKYTHNTSNEYASQKKFKYL